MKILNIALVVLFLTVSALAQVVPIVETSVGGIIGGAENGSWVKDERVAPLLKGQDEYMMVGWKGIMRGTTTGSKPIAEVPCEQFYHVELRSKADAGIALSSAAKWNPVPRIPVAISKTDATYMKIVGDFVRAKGILKPNVKITQAYRVDLDGDGTDEVILAATYFKSGRLAPSAAAGDYSFVMLRKIVGGKPQNLMLGGDFYKKAIKFDAINEHGISSIADLNGDGKMEIVTKSRYYEGNSSSVYEIRDATATEVLSTGCGV